MCEIFSIRANKKGVGFNIEAFEGARASNPDGAGFVIFEKDRYNKFDLIEMQVLEPKPKVMYQEYYYQNFDDLTPGLDDLAELDLSSPVARAYKRQKEQQAQTIGFHMKGGKHKKKKQLKQVYPVVQPDAIPELLFDKQNKLKANQFMVAHFRFATSGGVTGENTHPIVCGEYLVIHNGVFGYENIPEGMSDTRLFCSILQSTAKRTKANTPAKEQKLIKRLLEAAGGYYSVFVYSFKTRTLFYFKSEFASFQHDQSGLRGSTKESRFPIVILPPKNGIVR